MALRPQARRANSYCASRTPTRPARSKARSRQSWRACGGSVSTGTKALRSAASSAPYFQSERLDHYQAAADRLIESGHAYRFEDERGSAVKFAMPKDGSTLVSDVIRGRVEFDNSLIDDFVILKSDGFPTYHLASVVDDHLMRISHVIRGEGWLSSVAPPRLHLYEALGWQAPEFAHLPDILASGGGKLSKRHGAVSVNEYRQMGYLPHAMVNFLALLGWSYDDKTELFTNDELDRGLLAGAGFPSRERSSTSTSSIG